MNAKGLVKVEVCLVAEAVMEVMVDIVIDGEEAEVDMEVMVEHGEAMESMEEVAVEDMEKEQTEVLVVGVVDILVKEEMDGLYRQLEAEVGHLMEMEEIGGGPLQVMEVVEVEDIQALKAFV